MIYFLIENSYYNDKDYELIKMFVLFCEYLILK